jgi:hypothetical protein
VALTLLVFGIGQYGAWLALVGQATNDVEASQYGVASGIFKTATHTGAALAVAIAASVIESVKAAGHGADAYALAYLSAACLALAGAVAAVRLLGPTPRTFTLASSLAPAKVPLALAHSRCLISTYARRFAVT